MDGMLKVSRAILQKRQPQVGHLKKRDGTYTQTRGEVLDTLLDTFPDSTELRGVQASPLHYVIKDDIPDLFSPRKLEVAFKSFKKGKAPGPDGIGTEVLQNLDGVSLGRLALIHNVSLALGYVPERWRGAKAVSSPRWERVTTSHPGPSAQSP